MGLAGVARRIGAFAGVITVAIGFAPIMILSIATRSFWPSSHVNVPLSMVPSVLLGDSIFLPMFNSKSIGLLAARLTRASPHPQGSVVTLAAICACILSAGINIPLHRAWMSHGNTGFIALEPGRMSLAGWWHLSFASIQMAFVLWFYFVCFQFPGEFDRSERIEIVRACKLFVCYTALIIGDFGVWHLQIARKSCVSMTDLIALLPLPLSVGALALLKGRLSLTRGSERQHDRR